MQYHIQTLVKHLFDKDSFEQVTVEELKQFTDDYPFAAVGQFLYAKKLKDSGSYNHFVQSEQASLYFHNALWLRWQLENKEEAPALPVKAEEATQQQPGFRIVVQMPKTPPNIISTKPVLPPEEKKEEEPVVPSSETNEPVEAAQVEQNIQPAAEQTAAPAAEETVAENGLKVNENGSLVEQETIAGEQAPDTPPEQSATGATTETASTVAIAENSQLAEESNNAEAAVNAVSITEEVLIPPVEAAVAVVEVRDIDKEIDDIIPAVEITPEEVRIPPVEAAAAAVEATEIDKEIDDIIPAVEIIREEAPAEEEKVTGVEETPAAEVIAEAAPAEEIIPAAAIPEESEQSERESAKLPKPFNFAPAGQEGKTTVDLGEPIFESYHTIDYFASQGIKLMQEELKDKLGKQLKSFTDWLRSMKRIGPMEPNTSIDEVTNQSIQRIAEHSVEEKEVLTEAMAEVWAKQGNADKAIRVYEKLSLLNPAKSPYFAGRIEQLKAQ